MSKLNRQTFLSCLLADLSGFETVDKKSPFVDAKSVAATQLRESIFKKLKDPNPRADAKAIDKLISVNERCGAFKLVDLSSWDEEVIGTTKRLIDDFLHPNGTQLIDSYHQIFENGETGPGASVLGRGGDFYTKMFSSELSTTSLPLYSSYRSSIAGLFSWSNAERVRFTTLNGPKLVEGNRLSCVSKNVDISRTICTEPTLNMWYQLGCGNILRDRLRQFFGIDLASVADVNRRMAYLGSFDAPGSFSTIDLESASDSISLGLVDVLFPTWFSSVLKDLRSPVTRLPSGITLDLKMVSTMGNGFTFPLQTLIFSSVVCAVYNQLGITWRRVSCREPNWSVFGDDIVVRREAYQRVIHVLNLLGFSTNAQKSFSEGPFRESCGYDFFKGHMVRGVYLSRLACSQDAYVAFNKLVRWSASNQIALGLTLQYLLRRAPFNGVPFWEADDAGFKVPSWWKSVTRLKSGGVYAYKAWIPRQPKMVLADAAIGVPKSSRRRLYNPEGLMVSVSRGDWADGFCSVRTNRSKLYVQVRRCALNWDIPPVSDLRGYLQSEVGQFNWYHQLRETLRLRQAVGPVAGPVEGRQCDTVFHALPNW